MIISYVYSPKRTALVNLFKLINVNNIAKYGNYKKIIYIIYIIKLHIEYFYEKKGIILCNINIMYVCT